MQEEVCMPFRKEVERKHNYRVTDIMFTTRKENLECSILGYWHYS